MIKPLAIYCIILSMFFCSCDISLTEEGMAKIRAKELIGKQLSSPSDADFQHITLIDNHGHHYIYNIVVNAAGPGPTKTRLSYLTCFKMEGSDAVYYINNVVRACSYPPNEVEIAVSKELNGWPK